MKLFGLIGYPLGHSFSAGYFSEKFKKEKIEGCDYRNFPIENINLLPQLIQNQPALIGLNVTIPYKQQVIPFLNELDADAQKIGAVNCIKISRTVSSVSLKGFNTDAFGFKKSLTPHLQSFHNKALVLGSGGASKAVEFVLAKLGIEFITVSRDPKEVNQLSYKQLNEAILSDYLLIINTTPLGMYPKVEGIPDIPFEYISTRHILYDLVYNPLETQFLAKGKAKGATIINGLEMLHCQAERAWDIWNQAE